MILKSGAIYYSLLIASLTIEGGCSQNHLIDVSVSVDGNPAYLDAAEGNEARLVARVSGDWRTDTDHGRTAIILLDCDSKEELAITQGSVAQFNTEENLSVIVSDQVTLERPSNTCIRLRRLRMLFPVITNEVRLRNNDNAM
jgi:hypothetical protein